MGRKQCLKATTSIFKDLLASYHDGANLAARESMLNASFDAGTAFTRTQVGYVHAIAHQFGGLFHTPHGDANAMLLPHVLSFYICQDEVGAKVDCTERLCQLTKAAGLVESYEHEPAAMRAVARKFVARVSEMNAEMNIPAEVSKMTAADVKNVAARALTEAHGSGHSPLSNTWNYVLDLGMPVPSYMTMEDCELIVAECLPAAEKKLYAAAR